MESSVVDLTAAEVLDSIGDVFAVFDSRTQDSGHISYGLEDPNGDRWFVKTSGGPGASAGGATNQQRRASLRKSAVITKAVHHDALIPAVRLIESSDAVLTVSPWFSGELLHSPRDRRAEPSEPFGRFQRLPADEIVAALTSVIDLHVSLDAAGWTSGDLYDGCLMYDFKNGLIKVIDFEFYQRGSYVNDVGRLPGSTRFMAPEEFTKGAIIDARTTVFNLARMIEIFLMTNHPAHPAAELVARATRHDPAQRPHALGAFQAAWHSATVS